MLGETARNWLRRWDEQQERYSPDREERFRVILDVTRWSLERASPERPRIVDLGCGTGSLTGRLARALPHAQVVGVDADPMMLGLAEEAVAGTGARLYLDDLNSPGWADRAAPDGPWDAVVSSTALHWLEPADLDALYRLLADRLRPGGVFVDANNRPPRAPGRPAPWPGGCGPPAPNGPARPTGRTGTPGGRRSSPLRNSPTWHGPVSGGRSPGVRSRRPST
ncbi:class I SAM-dependent methyltransferase [Streptomyces sp. NPDC059816]|uniref:class I SAM-dependent methyltransferase n=1 Tax=Streptomyces sp. NPDC059816 TaxID=3346960 RepID=UPI0036634301